MQLLKIMILLFCIRNSERNHQRQHIYFVISIFDDADELPFLTFLLRFFFPQSSRKYEFAKSVLA